MSVCVSAVTVTNHKLITPIDWMQINHTHTQKGAHMQRNWVDRGQIKHLLQSNSPHWMINIAVFKSTHTILATRGHMWYKCICKHTLAYMKQASGGQDIKPVHEHHILGCKDDNLFLLSLWDLDRHDVLVLVRQVAFYPHPPPPPLPCFFFFFFLFTPL